jgi:translation initiation factor 6
LVISPISIEEKDVDLILKILSVEEIIPMSIHGASILGSLCAMNSHGIIVPNYTLEDDVKDIDKHINVGEIPSKLTAAGNNILCNDKAAYIHTGFDKRSKKIIADVLDVEIMEGTVAGLETVGSVAYATNKGLLVHPKATDKQFFDMPIKKTTANYGTPFIGACLIANSKGAVVGSLTTGIEMGNIEDSLDIID